MRGRASPVGRARTFSRVVHAGAALRGAARSPPATDAKPAEGKSATRPSIAPRPYLAGPYLAAATACTPKPDYGDAQVQNNPPVACDGNPEGTFCARAAACGGVCVACGGAARAARRTV